MSRSRDEEHIQQRVVSYLRMLSMQPIGKRFRFITTQHEGPLNIRMAKKRKSMGMEAGVPDILILFNGRCHAIELKKDGRQKEKNGGLSDAQKDYLDYIRDNEGMAFVTYGNAEPIEAVNSILGIGESYVLQ